MALSSDTDAKTFLDFNPSPSAVFMSNKHELKLLAQHLDVPHSPHTNKTDILNLVLQTMFGGNEPFRDPSPSRDNSAMHTHEESTAPGQL